MSRKFTRKEKKAAKALERLITGATVAEPTQDHPPKYPCSYSKREWALEDQKYRGGNRGAKGKTKFRRE